MVLSPTVPPLLASDVVYYGGPGCCCSIFIIWFFFWAINKFRGEFDRGQKTHQTEEEALDDLPKKKKRVMFKGEKVPDWKIAGRVKATRAVLKFLSYTDNWFDPKYVADVAEEGFRLVKEAIEARSGKGIERRVTPDCLEDLKAEVQELRRKHEVHVFDRIEVTDVRPVQVEAPAGKEQHTFTVLISAKSRDFFEDDEDGELTRGDHLVYAYQEFWTFRRSEKRWLVELIRPNVDVDNVLEGKNVMAAVEFAEFAETAEDDVKKEIRPV